MIKHVKLMIGQRYSKIKYSQTAAHQYRTECLITITQPVSYTYEYTAAQYAYPNPARRANPIIINGVFNKKPYG